MGYNLKVNISNRANYGTSRKTSNIKYIVIHYTANDGDTDEANGNYFKNNIVNASAHYFVDDNSITQSVYDNYVAWHCGDLRYNNYKKTGGAKYYNKCTNNNSIGIELCDTQRNGKYNVTDKTLANAIELVKDKMKQYNIPADRVIRHFDVSGKSCPKYFVDSEKAWKEFKAKLTTTKKTTSSTKTSYLVKITADVLNVRSGAGLNYKVKTTVKENEVYTIVQEKNGWGKLKSGAGWISLEYTKLYNKK